MKWVHFPKYGKIMGLFFPSWEMFQHVIPNFGKLKRQEIPALGKDWLKFGSLFPIAGFSLGKNAYQYLF